MRRAAIGIGAICLLAFPMVVGQYEVHVANIAGVYVILTLGMYLSFGLAGQISLAQGAFWGIGAYATALLMKNLGLPFWVALPVSASASAVFGMVVCLPAIRVRKFYLGMATVGVQVLMSLVFMNWVPVTGGANGIGSIPSPAVGPLAISSQRQVFYLILAFTLLAYLGARRLRVSRIGRACEALREDPLAAQAAGIDIVATKVLAFGLAAFYAGAAGSLYAVQIHYIEPKVFDLGVSVSVFAMLFFGGHRFPEGAAVGAIALILLPETLKALQNYYMALYGLGIILLLVYHPDGMVSLLSRWLRSLSRLIASRFGSLRAPKGQVAVHQDTLMGGEG